MPSKEIKELRQSGRLEEALAMAQAELEAKPDNIWGKRNICWVYYEYIKKYAHEFNYDGLIESLTKLKDLNLPQSEVMVFDTVAWQIASVVYKIQKTEPVDYSKINQLFDIIKEFHFTKPSEGFSLLYKSFHKGYHNWSRYIEFADWWDFESLRPEDYLKEEFKDKKIMALAEQAYIAYSKILIEGEPLDAYGVQRRIDTEKIKSFLPKLDSIIDKHPEYQYPPYFKAKLLLTLGDEDNVLEAFLPFAKQKRNDFWVWELMAEIYADNDEIKFACYCKALSLNTPEDFLVKIRQTFASMLVDKQMFPEAKTEIEKIIATRESHQWRLSNQLTQWTEQEWFKTSKAKMDNKDLYSKHLRTAEEILFQDIPEEIIVVEFVNHNKNMLNFVIDKNKHGFFNYSGQIDKPEIGDLLSVRFNGEGQDGYYKVLTVKKAKENESTKAIKNFEGSIKVIAPNNFGFIEDVFIEPKFIQDKNLKDGQNLKGKAILSFNKKKKEWGWKALKIE